MANKIDNDHSMSSTHGGRFAVAAGAILEHELSGKILLLKRATGEFNEGLWETGFGALEQGEDPQAGLIREFKEETGLDIKPKKLLSTWFFNRGHNNRQEDEVIGFTYWAVTKSQEVRLSPEHSEFKWVEPEKALELVEDEGILGEIKTFIKAKEEEVEIKKAQDARQRALADYQNLVRRTREERSDFAKMAAASLIEDIIEPLEHLSMASDQLGDDGLNMVVMRFWQVLNQHGLEEIEAEGKHFNVETMEVVEKESEGDKVVKVLRRGYTLNGKVVQHAKVVLGSAD